MLIPFAETAALLARVTELHLWSPLNHQILQLEIRGKLKAPKVTLICKAINCRSTGASACMAQMYLLQGL